MGQDKCLTNVNALQDRNPADQPMYLHIRNSDQYLFCPLLSVKILLISASLTSFYNRVGRFESYEDEICEDTFLPNIT